MDERSNDSGIGTWVLIGIMFALGYFIRGDGTYEGQTAEQWFDDYDASDAQVETLTSALEEANANIDTANSSIESAKSNQDGAYEDMNNALYSLETVSTVEGE
jgi:uncharacterized protein